MTQVQSKKMLQKKQAKEAAKAQKKQAAEKLKAQKKQVAEALKRAKKQAAEKLKAQKKQAAEALKKAKKQAAESLKTEKKLRAPRKTAQKKQKKQAKEPHTARQISAAAWDLRKPKTTRERLMVASKCGQDKCFMVPAELKYPVCGKDLSCDVDCDGVRSAYNLTAIQMNTFKNKPALLAMAEKAKLNARQTGVVHCGWKSS